MMDACNFIRVEGNKRETHLMMTMMTTIEIIKQTRIDVNIEKITKIGIDVECKIDGLDSLSFLS